MNDKEAIYDAEISPLMAQIIAIAKRAKINMVADFSLGPDPDHEDEPMYCTTYLGDVDPDDEDGKARLRRVWSAIKEQPKLFAFTIITSKDSP